MSCSSLASTGAPVALVITLGGALLVAGAVLLVLSRRGRAGTTSGRVGTAILLLLALTGALVAGNALTAKAQATTGGCPSGAGPVQTQTHTPRPTAPSPGAAHLRIVQTSTLAGLAPRVAPAAITGVITNGGSASAFVATVTVSITSVTGQSAGTCTPGDYVLLDAVMPVSRTLAAGGSADFAGARIGFRNLAVNQDACKRAVVNLRYVSSSRVGS